MNLKNLAIAACLMSATSVIWLEQTSNADVLGVPDNAPTLSAQDQGNSKEDIALTQSIREEVMKEKSFSTDAQNIKIITVNGNVALMGPVKSLNEKKRIERIARNKAGKGRVVSHIEVVTE